MSRRLTAAFEHAAASTRDGSCDMGLVTTCVQERQRVQDVCAAIECDMPSKDVVGGLHAEVQDGYVELRRVQEVAVSTRILDRRTGPSHLSLFLTASRMVLPQDLSTDPNCALLGRWRCSPRARYAAPWTCSCRAGTRTP